MAISVEPAIINRRRQVLAGSVSLVARVGQVTLRLMAPVYIKVSYPDTQS